VWITLRRDLAVWNTCTRSEGRRERKARSCSVVGPTRSSVARLLPFRVLSTSLRGWRRASHVRARRAGRRRRGILAGPTCWSRLNCAKRACNARWLVIRAWPPRGRKVSGNPDSGGAHGINEREREKPRGKLLVAGPTRWRIRRRHVALCVASWLGFVTAWARVVGFSSSFCPFVQFSYTI
jgi:hypothetical protein